MVVSRTHADRRLSDTEIREVLCEGLGELELAGKRVLVVIPDGTRTAPIGLLFAVLGDVLSSEVEALDYLIALGTHPPMDDAAKGRLLETTVVDGKAGSSRIFNHRWESPDTFATLGTIPGAEVAEETGGMLEMACSRSWFQLWEMRLASSLSRARVSSLTRVGSGNR